MSSIRLVFGVQKQKSPETARSGGLAGKRKTSRVMELLHSGRSIQAQPTKGSAMSTRMETSDLLDKFSELQTQLSKDGSSELLTTLRRILLVIVDGYKSQLNYEKLKTKNPDTFIQFMEPVVPLSLLDRENITKALAINRQIGVLLADFKKSKR
jgi:hypothetical protein